MIFFVANVFQKIYSMYINNKRKIMSITEKLEALHPNMKIVYERMLDGVRVACGITPSIARNLRKEASNIIREIVLYKLVKAHNVQNIFFITLNMSETERLKKYLQKKYKHLHIDVTEDELNDEVEELRKYFDCVISIAATESM